MSNSSDNAVEEMPGDEPASAVDLPEVVAAESKRAIEAIVMVAEEPADPRLLAQLLELPATVVDELCVGLAEEYTRSGRGFEFVKVAGGWRFQSRPSQAPYVERFVLEGQSSRLSAAALETLAIVAYKQPISRAQVSAIRGVNVDGVMRTLQQRGYIAELARDPGPGQAMLFGTTSLFLDRLGLNSLDELAPLGDFVPSDEVLEALEAGLRVTDIDEGADMANAVRTDPVEGTESDEVVVDLRDATLETPDSLEALDVLAEDSDHLGA